MSAVKFIKGKLIARPAKHADQLKRPGVDAANRAAAQAAQGAVQVTAFFLNS